MLDLQNVTLLGIDCVDIDRLVFASEISQKCIRFKDVKLLTSLSSSHPNIVKIPHISSVEAYSRFVIDQLHDYIDTEYVLIIQHDGFILNPEAWNPNFLNYDYIGAPVNWGMGNGGFSLRSKRLFELLAKENVDNCHPEDLIICRSLRPLLESKGVKFAPAEIAEEFSVENRTWNGQFGFHDANIHLWDIDGYVDLQKHSYQYKRLMQTHWGKNIKIRYIVQFYIENDEFNPLMELINIYKNYHQTIIEQIHFVFIDDHSPIKIEIPKDIILNYTLVRIKDEIPWNQAGARNLGVHFAKSDKIILADLDIVFPENLLDNLINFRIPRDFIFKFNTISGLKEVEPHFNVFYTTKEVFMKSNGVDEEFSGKYGYEDVFFYFLQKALGTKFYRYTFSNIVHREHKNSSERQHNRLVRDLEDNKVLNDEKMELMKSSSNPMDARSSLFLNFDWEVLQENLLNKE